MIQINKLKGLENISDCYCIDDNLNLWNVRTMTIKKASLGRRNYYYYSFISFETKIPWQTLYDITKGRCTGTKHKIYSLKVNRLGVVRNNCRRIRDKH